VCVCVCMCVCVCVCIPGNIIFYQSPAETLCRNMVISSCKNVSYGDFDHSQSRSVVQGFQLLFDLPDLCCIAALSPFLIVQPVERIVIRGQIKLGVFR